MTQAVNNSKSRRIEVSKAVPCIHCGKPDWCYRLGDSISVCKREINPASGWYATGEKDKEGTPLYATIASKEKWKQQKGQDKDKKQIGKTIYYRYRLVNPDSSGFFSHLHNTTVDLSAEEIIVCRKNYSDGDKEIFQGNKSSPEANIEWTVPPEWRERILPYGIEEPVQISWIQGVEIDSASKALRAPVFIAEGEKCVDALRRKGAKRAICNYGGGGKGKWRESDTQYLIDIYRWYNGSERENWQQIVPTVVLMPDRDKPGLEHSVEIFKSLRDAGYPSDKIQWYFPYQEKGWENLPLAHGLDIADMFDENPNLTVEDILKGIKTTEECPWVERLISGEIDLSELFDNEDDLGFCHLYLDEVTTDIDWTVQDILPSGYSVVLSGQSGSGKSVSAFDLVAAIAGGTSWLGKECKQGKVLVLNNDQSEMVLKRMLKTRLGEDMELRSQVAVKHGWVADEEGLARLRKWMKKYGFSLVVMDSIRECICHPLGISQNDAESGYKLKSVAEIVTGAGGCFVAIHHENKSKDSSGVEKASGSTSIISNVDAHWRITKGMKHKLTMPKTRGYSPVEVDYQIDFNNGICNTTAPSEDTQHSTLNSPTIGKRVVAYLEEEAPDGGATVKAMAEALEVKETSLREILRRLENDNIVKSVSVEGSKAKLFQLVAVEDE